MEPVIRLENIEKIYPNGDAELVALQDVSLEIEKGAFVAIVGRSGSGKTTLLNLIGTLDRPTAGKIYLEGRDISGLSDKELSVIRRQRVGFVFQTFNLLDEYTLWDNVCLPFYLDGAQPNAEFAEELLRIFDLWDRRDSHPSRLSGGQRQRVAIARAMVTRPAILLADEPTGNLDHKTGQEVMRMLKLAKEQYGQTVILVTHDMECAAQADYQVRIEDGRIAE